MGFLVLRPHDFDPRKCIQQLRGALFGVKKAHIAGDYIFGQVR